MTKARKARLEEARTWLAETSFSDDAQIIKAYRARFQVDRKCAMAELCLLNALNPEKQKAYEAELDRKKARKAEKANAQALIDDSNSDETFAYIAGYTSWGIPYGVTWDELENRPEPPVDIAPFDEQESKECIIFIGLQASGKTTFYQEFFSHLTHINLDTLHTRNKENLLLDECFADSRSFVVDNTNPTPEDRARYIGPAMANGYRITGYYFQSSISACKKRNSQRTGKALLPISALAATHKKLKLPEWSEGFDDLYYVRIEEGEFRIDPWMSEEDLTDEI